MDQPKMKVLPSIFGTSFTFDLLFNNGTLIQKSEKWEKKMDIVPFLQLPIQFKIYPNFESIQFFIYF